MRSKEHAHDYRYFPDPDLPPLRIDPDMVARARAELPELPAARGARYQSALGLSAYDAHQLTMDRELSDYFEALLAALPGQAKLCANWVLGELVAALHEAQLPVAQSHVDASALAALLARQLDGTLSGKLAKEVFAAMWSGAGSADAVIAARGLAQISDDGALLAAMDQVLAANGAQVAQFRAGDEKVFTWLVGQLMKATRGKANPQRLNELLRQRLSPP